ncbi:TauD/TfdA dioxygenase family protein [Catenulispora rubra]|uniref:TauD/TfdA dioxygenase family protein n=1 Tax=Catenulispora rubra TaxID=280293 RepID=UPI0018926DB3|nr:TauD/TfdA family dioxygenase [Catenulispora rubra]
MIETRALTPSMGVVVADGADLLDEALISQCVEALKWRGVLLVRGAHLDDERQLAFSRVLGEIVTFRGSGIFEVSLDPSVNPAAEYLKGTFHWHLDGMTDDTPIKATVLTARHVAMLGGGTEFASTYAAYENLPETDREFCENLRVVHSFEAAQRLLYPEPTEKQLAAWRTQGSHEAPLVWKRRDGRRSLVIGATADHIVGIEPADSRALLDRLLTWSTQDRFRYTHDWQIGDLVMWDNTGILHRALPYDPSSERNLHRTTIVGDEVLV